MIWIAIVLFVVWGILVVIKAGTGNTSAGNTRKRVAASGRQRGSGSTGVHYNGSDYRKEEEEETGTRIDFPHYITEDESQCSVCGARFLERLPVCPVCGARFGSLETDEREWDEEFDEECDMDEEEGW